MGKAGKLLRETLMDIGVEWGDTYRNNALMWRPPENRDPTPEEIRACNPRLMADLIDAQPKIIVPLGNFGVAAILGGKTGITRKRGIYREITIGRHTFGVLPTLHPASIFRSPDGYIDFYQDLAFAKRIADGEDPIVEPPYDNYVIINTQRGFNALMRRFKRLGHTSIDLETTSLDPDTGDILCVGMSWERETAVILDWVALIEDNQSNHEQLGRALSGVDCSFHNGQFDVMWLNSRGIFPRFTMDTMLAHYCLDERKGSHGLKRVAASYYKAPEYDVHLKSSLNTEAANEDRKAPLKLSLDDWDDNETRTNISLYCGADADFTNRLTEDLREEMIEDGVDSVHDDILIPAAHHFIDLERTGMKVDEEYHEELGARWAGELQDLEDQLRAYPGASDLNFNSPKQVSKYLFDDLGLNQMSAKKDVLTQSEVLEEIRMIEDTEAIEYWQTASSAVFSNMKPRSTSTYMLHWLAQQDEFPRLMVQHRLLGTKLKNYYHGYKALMRQGRIHPRYRLHGTRTGRLSSTDPNIHGMPRLKEIKKIFIADDGYVVIYADYSQAEIRALAHLSGDAVLREACAGDIHREVSKQLFRLTDADLNAMSEEERTFRRRAAKTIAFGIIYGRMPKSLAPQLGVTVKEAEIYRDRFLRQMPEASRWIRDQKLLVRKEHEVASIYGYKRRFPVFLDKRHISEIERQAVNTPIQNFASVMTLLANIRVMDRIREMGYVPMAWPHVHDGFGVQVPEEIAEEAQEIMIEETHNVGFETDVPFAVEVHRGYGWGDLEKVYEG